MNEAHKPQSSPLGTVYWDDEPGRTRVVKRFCGRCQRMLDAPMKSVHDVYVVSPSGVGHEAAINDPSTLCGVPADGANWWWRS